MSNDYLDFDSYWEEQKQAGERKPLVIKVFGKEYELPPSMPLLPALKTARLQSSKDAAASLTPDEVMDIAGAMFGHENLDAILAGGLDSDGLSDLIEKVATAYQRRGIKAVGADPEDKATADFTQGGKPAKLGKSSKGGPSSKRISSANTG